MSSSGRTSDAVRAAATGEEVEMTTDKIREALKILEREVVKLNPTFKGEREAMELLRQGVEKLPNPCPICGWYGCQQDHGYGGLETP